MKRLWVLIISAMVALVFAINANAAPVSFEKARQVAERWMERVGGTKTVLTEDILRDNGEKIGYLVTFSEGGFVAIPADDIFEPVKAWSREGSFIGDVGTMDLETLTKRDLRRQREVLFRIKDRLATISAHKGWVKLLNRSDSDVVASAVDDLQVVGPLLTTKWGQYYPYNAYCPYDTDGYQSITGCVATATAQIMRYWRFPDYGVGEKCYYDYLGQSGGCGSDQEICANFEHLYAWNLMPNILSSSSSEVEIDATARLMADVGVMVEMCYSSNGSYASVSDLREALELYCGYSYEMKEIGEYRDNFFSTAKIEIDKYWPVFFGSNGHAYVLDGYRIDLEMDQVHFNFGWNGNSDGWFTLEEFEEFWNCPEENTYVYMIINIHPEGIINPPNQAPIVDSFSVSPIRDETSFFVLFTCEARDSDGYIVEYRWDFNGDNIIDQITDSGNVSCAFYFGWRRAIVIAVDDDGATTRSGPVKIARQR